MASGFSGAARSPLTLAVSTRWRSKWRTILPLRVHGTREDCLPRPMSQPQDVWAAEYPQ